MQHLLKSCPIGSLFLGAISESNYQKKWVRMVGGWMRTLPTLGQRSPHLRIKVTLIAGKCER
jgi:hypothetical protein